MIGRIASCHALGGSRADNLGALKVGESKLNGHVDEEVRSSLEETLSAMLDEEGDQICRAALPAHARVGR